MSLELIVVAGVIPHLPQVLTQRLCVRPKSAGSSDPDSFSQNPLPFLFSHPSMVSKQFGSSGCSGVQSWQVTRQYENQGLLSWLDPGSFLQKFVSFFASRPQYPGPILS